MDIDTTSECGLSELVGGGGGGELGGDALVTASSRRVRQRGKGAEERRRRESGRTTDCDWGREAEKEGHSGSKYLCVSSLSRCHHSFMPAASSSSPRTEIPNQNNRNHDTRPALPTPPDLPTVSPSITSRPGLGP